MSPVPSLSRKAWKIDDPLIAVRSADATLSLSQLVSAGTSTPQVSPETRVRSQFCFSFGSPVKTTLDPNAAVEGMGARELSKLLPFLPCRCSDAVNEVLSCRKIPSGAPSISAWYTDEPLIAVRRS